MEREALAYLYANRKPFHGKLHVYANTGDTSDVRIALGNPIWNRV